MKKETIEKLALTVATLVVDASQRTISSWTNELKVLRNIQIDRSAFAMLLLESVAFGHYYVGEKFKGYMNESERKIFADELNKKMIFMLALMLDSKDKEKNSEAHEAIIKEMYNKTVPDNHKALANYKGNTIIDLFKETLRQIFNSNDFKIKFFENTFKNRLKLKIGGTLSSSNTSSKFKDDIFLDNKVLYVIPDTLFAEFSAMNYEQLNRDAEKAI